MATTTLVPLSDAVANNRFSAEFFDPQYVFKPKEPSDWLPIGRILRKCEYGISVAMNTNGAGYPMFRMNEIENCFVQRAEKHADISASLFERYRLRANDVLFNRTNSFDFVGRTGIVIDQTDSTFASYLIRLIPDSSLVTPEFLTVYLNTSFGVGQVKRRAMRSINQANVSGSEIRRVLIPLMPMEIQEEVSETVKTAHGKLRKGESLYAQAQQLLESELGLDELCFDRPVGYTAQFSELELSHRTDAQHYQPRFAQLLKHLAKFPTTRIRDVRRHNRRGIQPIYVENGSHAVINSQHLGPKHIDYNGLERTSDQAFNAAPEAHIQPDDLLIYTTGAYIGRTNVYLDDAPAFASNHVNILRLGPDIDHAYMSMVFQSIIGQFQTEKHARGSAQAELYPADIDKFVVPLLAPEKQKKIGDGVRESLKKQRESAQLLEQAKARVEELIEEVIES